MNDFGKDCGQVLNRNWFFLTIGGIEIKTVFLYCGYFGHFSARN
jgi:hypothetical protein